MKLCVINRSNKSFAFNKSLSLFIKNKEATKPVRQIARNNSTRFCVRNLLRSLFKKENSKFFFKNMLQFISEIVTYTSQGSASIRPAHALSTYIHQPNLHLLSQLKFSFVFTNTPCSNYFA